MFMKEVVPVDRRLKGERRSMRADTRTCSVISKEKELESRKLIPIVKLEQPN